MKIPLVDLYAQYRAHQREIDTAIRHVIENAAFIGGETVRQFETSFARDYGIAHCVSVGNGTDAIYIALKMLGIGLGDEVITSAHTWISTSEAVSQVGARPVFVDVDDFYTIDPERIEAAITPRTRMLLPVHLYGQAADMDRIMSLARKYGLLVLEDCAQAHYATWKGRRVGTFGNAATFSFYPGKNLGAYGDAGAIITSDDALATKLRRYANHGSLSKHDHAIEGVNSRLDGLQAAVLSAKLPHIHEWTKRRQEVAALYGQRLSSVLSSRALPRVREGASHVYHLYVVQVDHRNDLAAFLKSRGIDSGVHYPVALPFLPAYSRFNHRQTEFPNAARNQVKILSLPIYPELTSEMVQYVADAVRQFYEEHVA